MKYIAPLLLVFAFIFTACSDEGGDVVPRSEWSNVEPDVKTLARKPNGKIRYISIHQSETPFPDTVDAVRRLRGIQNWHQNNPGGPKWGDIAYHYLIGPEAKIYEGRSVKYAASSGTIYLTQAQWEAVALNDKGQTTASKPAGIEKPGASEGHLTISVLGTFHRELPSDETRRVLTKFVAQKLKEHDLSVDDVYFHREIACWTDCPGQALYDWFRGKSREHGARGTGMNWIADELDKLR
ncbi:MAG: peptidoglycan recognition family protein [Verrucomicrobiales bacterium]|nr:peptidoglycan recognition family protein [Verrucomicrobiales bacterium]